CLCIPPLAAHHKRTNIMLAAIDLLVRKLRFRDQKQIILKSGLFDEEWYKLANPYVVRAGVDRLTHFLKYGKRYRRSPGPAFDSARYLEDYDIARLSQLYPLVHYVKVGKAAGFKIHSAPLSAADRILASCLFDPDWYSVTHPEISLSGLS